MTKSVTTYIKDGFKNVLKGLGGNKDPREWNLYQPGLFINQVIANNLYVYNWLAAKVVDIPIDDATRKWRNLLISDTEKKKAIEESLKAFNVRHKINLVSKWARVYGGAVVLIIIEGEDQEEPLIIEKIKKDSLKNFIVLDRYNVYPDTINRNILSGNFGKPEYYTVTREGQRLHHSRIIKFQGVIPTIREYEQQNYWGNSIFTKGWEPISDSQVVSQSISTLIYESNVDVYKIKDLYKLIAQGDDKTVIDRLKVAHEMKSMINGIALDSEDDYNKKSNNFTTLPEIDDRFMQKVAGAYDIPMTRLLGISPAGQNATGESDMLNYHDNVQSIQENIFRPALDIIDGVVLASEFQEYEVFEYEFKPLKQLTELEQAEVDVKNKDKDIGYLDAGVIQELDVLAQLAERGTYISIDENRVEEERQELEELEKLEGFEEVGGAFKEEEVDPNTALNGAQVTAMLEIVRQVTTGELDKETGARVIAASFPMTEGEALMMLSSIEIKESEEEPEEIQEEPEEIQEEPEEIQEEPEEVEET